MEEPNAIVEKLKGSVEEQESTATIAVVRCTEYGDHLLFLKQ